MVYYRRNYIAGGTYFFTVNLRNREADYLTRYVLTPHLHFAMQNLIRATESSFVNTRPILGYQHRLEIPAAVTATMAYGIHREPY